MLVATSNIYLVLHSSENIQMSKLKYRKVMTCLEWVAQSISSKAGLGTQVF